MRLERGIDIRIETGAARPCDLYLTPTNLSIQVMKWSITEYDEVNSTQAIANRLADAGAPEGTVVVARSQTAGRGRMGRSWVSPAGGLYMSFILRPPSQSNVHLLTLLTALAVTDSITKVTEIPSRIRWPNDVMIGTKKVAGVIAESSFERERLSHTTLGIGVNIASVAPSLAEVSATATTICDELHHPVEIHVIRDAILESFARSYNQWLGGADPISLSKARIGTIGRQVTVKLGNERTPRRCRALDIAPDGALVLESGGRETTLHAEDVEWLRENS